MELKQGNKQSGMGAIPKDWQWMTLRRTCRAIYRGASPRPIGDARWFDDASSIGWVRISDVTQSNRYLRSTSQRLSKAGVSRSRLLSPGSLIMSICATVGRPIELAIDACIHDGFVVFERPTINQSFLYHVLCDLEPQWSKQGQTGSQMNLNTSLIKLTSIAVPSAEPEQQAIAAALSDVDGLIASLDRLIAKKRAIKQAAMQQLLTGKTRLPGFSGQWRMRTLNSLADIDSDNLGTSTSPLFEFRYLSLEDVERGVIRGWSEQVFRSAPSRARRRVQDHDILFATVRPNLKSHMLIPDGFGRAVCSTGFAVIRCKPTEAAPEFVFAQLFAHGIEKQVEAVLAGSNYPAINSRDVKRLTMPAPEVEEQAAIGRVLGDMDGEIAALGCRRDKAKAIKQGMMQALLTGRVRLPVKAAVGEPA